MHAHYIINMTQVFYLTLEDTAKFYQQELSKLYHFLEPLKGIWSVEVLGDYPTHLGNYPASWIDALDKIGSEGEWEIEIGNIPENLNCPNLSKLFQDLALMEDLPQWKFNPSPKQATDYPSWALNFVSEKKQHEIFQLSALLDQSLKKKSSLKMVDIGGGKGHLARILALYHGHHLLTLDTNKELQVLGEQRRDAYPHPEGAGTLEFLNHTFGPHSESPELDAKIFKEAQVTLGLHTCGPLALEHIQTYQNHQSLYNFGCCYQKLTEKEVGLSQYVKKSAPLEVGKYALTLASRGHTKITEKDYQLKRRVKLYRAALHLWMAENTKDNTFITVGSARPRDYFGSFGSYASSKLAKFNLCETPEVLDAFYERAETQEQIKKILLANLVRWRFGRIVEKFILLDRALAQVEQGKHAQLYQIFDAELSPRNTVLYIPSIHD